MTRRYPLRAALDRARGWMPHRIRHPLFHFVPPLVITLALGAAAVLLFRQSTPLVMVEARTGSLSFKVTRPAVSAIAFRDALLARPVPKCHLSADRLETRKLTALVRSAAGVTISYAWNPGFVLVTFEPPAPSGSTAGAGAISFQQQDRICNTDETVAIVVPEAAMARMAPLPVIGPGSIGIEFRAPVTPKPADLDVLPWLTEALGPITAAGERIENAAQGYLYEGTATVYGRTQSGDLSGSLYPVPDSQFHLPRGSRLQTSNTSEFFGSASLNRAAPGLDVDVTTEASELQLIRIGSQRAGQPPQSETFASGVMSRAFGDPSVAPALLMITVYLAVLNIWLTLAGIGGTERAAATDEGKRSRPGTEDGRQ